MIHPIHNGITRPFLAGLVAVLPLALTVAIILWVVQFVENMLGPGTRAGRILAGIGVQFSPDGAGAYLFGIFVTIGAIYILGVLLEGGLKRQWQSWTDRLLSRVPLVGTIYSTASKMMGMMFDKDNTQLKGMSPVWCTFGGEGGVAVLGLMPSPDEFELHGHKYRAVLVPSAPVPFGGGLLYVPSEWVKPADFAVERLLDVYVSMGIASPVSDAKRLDERSAEKN